MAQRPRGFETVGDMARSLGVTFALIGFILLVTHRDHGDGIREVGWRPVVSALPAPLLKPAALPHGYRVTSARRMSAGRPGLHIGSLTTAGRYIGVEEAVTTDSAYLGALVSSPRADGTQSIGGHEWARWIHEDHEGHVTRALTRVQGSVTLVVLGTASWVELADLISVARL